MIRRAKNKININFKLLTCMLIASIFIFSSALTQKSQAVASVSTSKEGLTAKFESDATEIKAGDKITVNIYAQGKIQYMHCYVDFDTSIFELKQSGKNTISPKLTISGDVNDGDYGEWSKGFSSTLKISFRELNATAYDLPNNGLIGKLEFTAIADAASTDIKFTGFDLLGEGDDLFPDDVTLTIPQAVTTHKVTYNTNGGTLASGAVNPVNVNDGKQHTVYSATRANYDLKEWTGSDGNTYLQGQSITINKDLTLTAKWKYDVIYNANGGTGAPATQTSDYGNNIIINNTIPTKKGYTFKCWNTKSDGSGKDYNIGDTYNFSDGNTTLYAKWTLNTYKIRYNSNGGTGTIADEEFSYGESKKLTKNTYVKSGYTFEGWSTTALGETEYSDEQTVSNLTETNGEIITLYAVWKKETYTITYTLDGGNATNPTSYTTETESFTLNNPTKRGYTFIGWTGSNGTTPQTTITIGKGTSGNKSYIANYKINTYKIKFDANGGTGTIANEEFTYEESKKLTKNTYVKTGYTFEGWSTTSSGRVEYSDEQTVSNLTEINDEIITLYAVWTPVTYTIKYNGNGSTSGSMIDSTFLYGTSSVILKNNTFIKIGYEFKGWDTSSAGTQVVYTNASTIDTTGISLENREINLYAVWEAKKITVTFEANSNGISGGNVTPSTKTVIYDSTYQELPVPTREGYIFDGWYTTEAFSNKITAESRVENAMNHTLYAKWSGNKYTITYYDGETKLGESTKIHDVDTNINYPVADKIGYEFKGWATADDLNTVVYKNNTVYNKNADLSLYAVWSILEYTVTFENEDGTILKVEKVQEGKNATAPENPSKDASEQYTYTFAGWDKSFDNITSDVVVKATYTKVLNTYTVIFENEDGTILKKEKVEYGKSATAPEAPSKTSTDGKNYVFAGWDKSFDNITSDVVVKATYTERLNQYTVTFYDEDGTTILEQQTVPYGQKTTYKKENPTGINEKGYTKTFIGWDNADKLENVTENVNVKAKYSKNLITYTITYEDEYVVENNNVTTYTVEDAKIKLLDLTKENKIFKGWYTSKDYTEKVTEIDTSDAKNLTLYAYWEDKDEDIDNNNEDLYLKSKYYMIGETSEYVKGDIYASRIKPETTLKKFKDQSETNGIIEVYKTNGTKLEDDDYVGTNMTITVTKDEQKITLTAVVIADLDGNGRVTVTDLSMMNKTLIGDIQLNPGASMAADIDFNNKISISDLSMMNKILIGSIIL